MVRPRFYEPSARWNSPRIRGDGPIINTTASLDETFSPYSRGWSLTTMVMLLSLKILPVFAGMVPFEVLNKRRKHDSPRIRGDGPTISHIVDNSLAILPVFAGMVPTPGRRPYCAPNSPRIRGDGPRLYSAADEETIFSPYSRGWSLSLGAGDTHSTILPVFAGMVPAAQVARTEDNHSPRIRGDGPHSKCCLH